MASAAMAWTFAASMMFAMTDARNWLGCATSDGKVITFFGTGRGIWTGTSEDGVAWKAGATLAVRGADPGVVALPDGSLIVVATTAPRPGTPSDRLRAK